MRQALRQFRSTLPRGSDGGRVIGHPALEAHIADEAMARLRVRAGHVAGVRIAARVAVRHVEVEEPRLGLTFRPEALIIQNFDNRDAALYWRASV